MATKRLKKELKQMRDHPPEMCLAFITDQNLFAWTAYITGPEKSPYSGGVFELSINFLNSYPFIPPKVKFVTRIFHPNISTRGNICLDILDRGWSPALTVSKLLLSIISLLTDPNPDDPLNYNAGKLYNENYAEFENQAATFTKRYATNTSMTSLFTKDKEKQ